MSNPLLRPAACLAVAFMLLLDAVLDMPDSYSVALGVMVFLVGVMEIVLRWRVKKTEKGTPFWIWALVGLTVVFNPLVPFENSRTVWIAADVYGAVVFGWAAVSHLRKLRFVRKPTA